MLKKMNEWKVLKTDTLNKKDAVCIISCIMTGLVCWIFIIASRWSFYMADDFSHANAAGIYGNDIWGLFRASVGYMIQMYKTWQGTYFAMFLQEFLSPLSGFGEKQLAAVMTGSCLLFMAAVILLVREICGAAGMERHVTSVICFLVLFSVLGFRAWTEIFYWFSGAVSYTIPLSMAMLADVFYLENRNMPAYVAACILAFLASGGSLEVAGTSCFGILIILSVKGYKNLRKKDYIFFSTAVLGALINAAAPGNFVRRGRIDSSGLHAGAALIRSVHQVILSFEYLLFQTPFLMIVILCVIIGIYAGGGKWFSKLAAYKLIAMCAVMPVVTCFPVCLAYHLSDGRVYFPNRCEFVCVFVVIIAIMSISVMLGVFLADTGIVKGYKAAGTVLLISCLIMSVQDEKYRYSNTVIYRMYNSESVHAFKNYHESVMEIYRKIEKDEDADVVIDSLPAAVSDFPDMGAGLSVDSKNWQNQSIAGYYGKNSVALKPQE